MGFSSTCLHLVFFETGQTIGLAIHTLLANISPERAVTDFLGTNVIPNHILRDSELRENEEMEAFFFDFGIDAENISSCVDETADRIRLKRRRG
jgi:hypothetical protein